ncbi:hypothetical protein Q7P36_008687 [Cladosporium allicinum]
MGHDRSYLLQYNRAKSGITQNTMSDTPEFEIHPLFAKERFEPQIKYNRAIYNAAVLATRIMDTPQALQHYYCFFFGTNTSPVKLPRRLRRRWSPEERPTEYACDKGVGELDERDIEAVQAERIKLSKRISYEFDSTGGDCGWTHFQDPVDGVSGCDSVTRIDTTLYQAAKDRNKTPDETARMTFLMANTMYHEVMHAANNHLFGLKREDFREISLCAEGGFKLESRLYGATPEVQETELSHCSWYAWQSLETEIPRGFRHMLSRDRELLPDSSGELFVSEDFVRNLCDDDFWSGEYVRRGAKALVPYEIAKTCRDERDTYSEDPGDVEANLNIPLSIRDLFWRRNTPSYAQRLYSHCSNPDLVLRSEQPGPASDDSSDGGNDSDSLDSDDTYDSSSNEDGDGAEGVVEEEEDRDDVNEDGSDVDEDAMSVDEEGSVVDEDQSVVDADDMDVDEDEDEDEDEAPPPPPKKGKASTTQTGSKRVREDSDYEDEAPAPKKTKNPTKKSRR